MERNITLSLTKGTSPSIVGKKKLFDLLKDMATSQELSISAKRLKEASSKDKSEYDQLKEVQPGFVIGDFSYRNVDSCVEYFPLIGFDIDSIKTEKEVGEISKALKAWEYTALTFPSISGAGIRILVFATSTKETHKDYYEQIAGEISRRTGVPLKSKIRDGLKAANVPAERINDFLKQSVHVDDVTSDISRFWFYSGLNRSEIYYNKDSKVYELTEIKQPTKKEQHSYGSKDYPYIFTEDEKVEYLINKIEQRRIDLTSGLVEWFKVGVSLAWQFGEAGRGYFHRCCQFHPAYKHKESDREFNRCLAKCSSDRVTIGTFYDACQKHGVEIDFKELIEIHRDKFEQAKKKRVELEKVANENPQFCRPNEEAAIIGFCLTVSDGYELILDEFPKFSSECFVNDERQLIFNGIERCYSSEGEVSLPMVKEKLSQFDYTVEQLMPFCKADFLSDFYKQNAKIVYGNYLKRKMLTVANDMKSELVKKDTEPFEYLNDTQAKLSSIGDFEKTATEAGISTVMFEVLDNFEKAVLSYRANEKTVVTGIPTGITEEDKILGGFQKQNLVILAARPGMGKTSKLLVSALAAAKAGYKVGIFSLEMSKRELGARLVSMEAEIDGRLMQSGAADYQQAKLVERTVQYIHSLPITIDDRSGVTPEYVKRVCKKWKRKQGLDIVFIDYLQLMTIETRKEETAKTTELSNKAKGLAKELDIPVVALSQLSRATEIRGGTSKPKLSDLRQSGAIEQDADVVIFIYRPEYYDILSDDSGNSTKGLAQIDIAKHRNGPTDEYWCQWLPHCTKFKDKEDYRPNLIAPPATNWHGVPVEKDFVASEFDKEFVLSNVITRPKNLNDDEDIPF